LNIDESQKKANVLAILERIFSREYYLAAHPDVATAGLDAWHHFSNHGFLEGLSPSPYIDPSYMADLVGVPLREVLLEAFSNTEHWTTNTSPYVDIQSFVINGPWDGSSHPLLQIVEGSHTIPPWVRFSTAFSDLPSIPETAQRKVAISLLSHMNGQNFKSSQVKDILQVEESITNLDFESEEEVNCIPGFHVVVKGRSYSLDTDNAVLSPDKTAIRHGRRITVSKQGEYLRFNSLLLVPRQLNYEDALVWLNTVRDSTVLIPASEDQEYLLRHCINIMGIKKVSTLVFGTQTRIICKKFVIGVWLKSKQRKNYRKRDNFRRRSVVIIAESNHDLAKNIEKASRIIGTGASVCISTNVYVSLWLPLLSQKKLVILCGVVGWADLWISKKVPMIQISDWG
jgi:hypothetical protein